MYNTYFGLKETPFSIAPDPRYLYMSEQHREALAHLLYGVNADGGFVLLTGEVGTGKTTVCRCLLEQIPKNCDVAFIFNPTLTVHELLSTICDELGIQYPAEHKSIKVFIDLINDYLLDAHAKGRKTVLIIDEAQNLSMNVLEQIRLLTNLETNQRKLLQVILLGQPELQDLLSKPKLRQLAQRVIARYHLGSLSRQEVGAYVNHRLAVAGLNGQLFPPSTIAGLYRLSGGIPRLINILCDRALLGTYAQGKRSVDLSTLRKAAREVFGKATIGTKSNGLPQKLFKGLALLGAFLLLFAVHNGDEKELVVASSPPAVEQEGKPTAPHRKPVTATKPAPVVQESSSTEVHPTASGSSTETAPDVPSTADSERVASVQGDHASDNPPPKSAPGPVAEGVSVEALQWPQDQPVARSEMLAFQALFRQWGAVFELQEEAGVCRQAESSGLRCLPGWGGLNDLRKMNHPAVLKLFDSQGQLFYATLTNLTDQTATFVMGNKTTTVAVDEIALRWRGDYTLIWRAPAKYRGIIREGDKGPLVEWLESRLAKIQGEKAAPRKDPVFDIRLTERVKKFQWAAGLKPDGVVGPKTMVLLSSAVENGAPLLMEKKKEN